MLDVFLNNIKTDSRWFLIHVSGLFNRSSLILLLELSWSWRLWESLMEITQKIVLRTKWIVFTVKKKSLFSLCIYWFFYLQVITKNSPVDYLVCTLCTSFRLKHIQQESYLYFSNKMKYLYLRQTQDTKKIFIDIRILYNTMLQFLYWSKKSLF